MDKKRQEVSYPVKMLLHGGEFDGMVVDGDLAALVPYISIGLDAKYKISFVVCEVIESEGRFGTVQTTEG